MPHLTENETRAIESRLVAASDLRRGSRFREPVATRIETDRLRRVLSEQAIARPEDVRLVRGYMNDLREEGATILTLQIDNAVRLLTS